MKRLKLHACSMKSTKPHFPCHELHLQYATLIMSKYTMRLLIFPFSDFPITPKCQVAFSSNWSMRFCPPRLKTLLFLKSVMKLNSIFAATSEIWKKFIAGLQNSVSTQKHNGIHDIPIQMAGQAMLKVIWAIKNSKRKRIFF